MARLLHDSDETSGRERDLCADLRDDSTGGESTGHDSDCGCKGRRRHHRHHRRSAVEAAMEDLIPIGCIEVDCTPVSFTTPGQARNVVSCPVSQPISVPCTQTSFVDTPGPFGCVIRQPVTQTVNVECVATVNMPPTLVPIPQLVCPPTACAAVKACECQ